MTLPEDLDLRVRRILKRQRDRNWYARNKEMVIERIKFNYKLTKDSPEKYLKRLEKSRSWKRIRRAQGLY